MIELLLLAIAIALALLAVYLYIRKNELEKAVEQLQFEKRSQSVKYGRLTEQFVPFIEGFPFDSEQFRFIGNPIDGVVFGNDEIIFCEFKAAGSKMSERQRKIKEQVEGKRVKWFEFNLR